MFRRCDPQLVESTRTRLTRTLDEMVGLCQGLLADGALAREEASFLLNWMQSRPVLAQNADAQALLDRLGDALADGVLDEDEERDILAAVAQFAMPEHEPNSGLTRPQRAGDANTLRSVEKLPFLSPTENLLLIGAEVVLTGVFLTGSRATVTALLEDAGAVVNRALTKRTRYIIVGKLGSSEWRTSSGGSKIIEGLQRQAQGELIDLVAEQHLIDQISRR